MTNAVALIVLVALIALVVTVAAHLVIRRSVKNAQHYTPGNAPTFVAPKR